MNLYQIKFQLARLLCLVWFEMNTIHETPYGDVAAKDRTGEWQFFGTRTLIGAALRTWTEQ